MPNPTRKSRGSKTNPRHSRHRRKNKTMRIPRSNQGNQLQELRLGRASQEIGSRRGRFDCRLYYRFVSPPSNFLPNINTHFLYQITFPITVSRSISFPILCTTEFYLHTITKSAVSFLCWCGHLLIAGQGYFKKDLEVTARDATIVCLALMGGAELENLNFAPILMKRLSVLIPSIPSIPF